MYIGEVEQGYTSIEVTILDTQTFFPPIVCLTFLFIGNFDPFALQSSSGCITVLKNSNVGVAVTMDMLTTTGLVTLVMIMVWQLPTALAVCFLFFFGIIELAFFSSTLLKVPHGGW